MFHHPQATINYGLSLANPTDRNKSQWSSSDLPWNSTSPHFCQSELLGTVQNTLVINLVFSSVLAHLVVAIHMYFLPIGQISKSLGAVLAHLREEKTKGKGYQFSWDPGCPCEPWLFLPRRYTH